MVETLPSEAITAVSRWAEAPLFMNAVANTTALEIGWAINPGAATEGASSLI
jgi:hypothetical protein